MVIFGLLAAACTAQSLTFRGTVVDAATKAKVTAFRVIPGVIVGDRRQWLRHQSVVAKDGTFELTIPRPSHEQVLRVEAAGHVPGETEPVPPDAGTVDIEVALQGGTGLSGQVVGTDGKPVVGAKVVLCPSGQHPQFENGELIPFFDHLASVVSDRAGHFELPFPEVPPYRVIASHELGYGAIAIAADGAPAEITLQPWISVTGTVRHGEQVIAGAQLRLQSRQGDGAGGRTAFIYNAKTAADGTFAWPQVVPGLATLLVSGGEGLTSRELALVVAGPETVVDIGGDGRDLVGNLTLPADAAAVKDKLDWLTGMYRLERVLSPEALAEPPAQPLVMGVDVVADTMGTIHSPDLPIGKWKLTAEVNDSRTELGAGPLASLNFEFEVTGQPADGELALGDVPVEVRPAHFGPAQTFEVAGVNGGTIKLADYQGKFVLLEFWASWDRASVAASSELKALSAKYQGNPKLAMVSLSLDKTAEAAKAFCMQQGRTWPQGYVGEWSKSQLPWQYKISGLPGFVLVNPEGNIAARGLRIGQVEAALSLALQ